MIHQVIDKRNQLCFLFLDKLQTVNTAEKVVYYEKISSDLSSQLLLEVSAYRIHISHLHPTALWFCSR